VYVSVDKREIERDCDDFRASPHGWYCLFSRECSGPIEQKMYVDNFCGNGRERCLGICDEKKIPMIRQIQGDKPTRLKQVVFFKETKEERVFELPEIDFENELEKTLERFPDLIKMEMNIRTGENRLVVIPQNRGGNTDNLGYDYDED
jgi:hypothetical protein